MDVISITGWKTPAQMIAETLATSLDETLVLGTNLFVGSMPMEPGDAVAVYDSGNNDTDPVNALDWHSNQVIVRNAIYLTGYNIANQIKAVLESSDPFEIDGEKIVGIWFKSGIISMPKDHNSNSIFSSNYRVAIETKKNVNR